MSGTMLDLMPDGIRRRTQAGQRLRRFMAIGVVVIGAIVAFATHSQMRRDHLEESLVVARARAAQALKLEREAADMGVLREEIESYMLAYEQVALPMRMDDLMGRVVAALPDSATVDHLLLDDRRIAKLRLGQPVEARSRHRPRRWRRVPIPLSGTPDRVATGAGGRHGMPAGAPGC